MEEVIIKPSHVDGDQFYAYSPKECVSYDDADPDNPIEHFPYCLAVRLGLGRHASTRPEEHQRDEAEEDHGHDQANRADIAQAFLHL